MLQNLSPPIPSSPQASPSPLPQPVVAPVVATNTLALIEEDDSDLEYIDGTEAPPLPPTAESESSRGSTPMPDEPMDVDPFMDFERLSLQPEVQHNNTPYVEFPNKLDPVAPLTRNIPACSLYHEPGFKNLLPLGVIHPNYIRDESGNQYFGSYYRYPNPLSFLSTPASQRKQIGEIVTSFHAVLLLTSYNLFLDILLIFKSPSLISAPLRTFKTHTISSSTNMSIATASWDTPHTKR
ncbi:hypothetical protein H0H92_004262 [Tricholoma furcatifolium]|nr:hypothetical protein H0H92_004262 [Tricholoma furcatifolium]